jgi:protein TonB
MLGGFDPRSEKVFFARRRTGAILGALAIYAAALALGLSQQGQEQTVDVLLEPELKDFAVEEEPPEIEEEPPPPPPPNAKVDVTAKPKPKPKIKPPIKPQGPPAETDKEKTYGPGTGGSDNAGNNTGAPKTPPKPKVEPPKPKVEPPKPKPKPAPTAEPIDPTKPIDRPENASAPKPDPGNKEPVFPEALLDAGVTGEIQLKIHVHRDGTVRGAKVFRTRSSATTDEEKAEAEKLFLQAAIAAVKTWKFEPAKVGGEAISVWHTITIPFKAG